jgi:predicted DNA-binding protein with PD1-like motif
MVKGRLGNVFFERIMEDEDLVDAIKMRAEKNGVKAGFFIVIGSIKKAVLGYLRNEKYENLSFDGPLEIASGMGDIAVDEKGKVIVHAHLTVSDYRGRAFGGHLMQGSPVGVTAELVIVQGLDVNLLRVLDKKTGLKLLKLE